MTHLNSWKSKSYLTLFFLSGGLSLSITALASEATVVSLRGKAIRDFENQRSPIKENDRLPQGAIVTTGPESAVKLMLADRSFLSIGPDSSTRLDQLQAQYPGAATLMKGQVRSKVEADPLAEQQQEPAKKSKFFIRTRTATMGVRGTDFQVIYNVENKVTSVVTFEGMVSMVKMDQSPGSEKSRVTFSQLDLLLNSAKSVSLTAGTFSSAHPESAQPTIPTRLSPAQFEALKNNELVKGKSEKKPTEQAKSGLSPKGYSPIPPGVDPKTFVSGNTQLEQQLIAALPKDSSVLNMATPGASPVQALPPPEGFYNKSTGAYAPPAGGFLDPKTGIYVPPPPGSAYDSNTGVFVPPPGMGKVDPVTGSYLPPAGFQLDPTKGFVAMNPSGDPSARTPGAMAPSMIPPGTMPSGTYAGYLPPPPPGSYPPPPVYEPVPYFPVNDPYCPTCAPYLPPPPPPTSSTTINFAITVN